MKQTAVEWLEIQLFKKQGKFNKSDIDQAKAMEKEQIVDAYMDGVSDEHNGIYSEKSMNEYYNETFKSE